MFFELAIHSEVDRETGIQFFDPTEQVYLLRVRSEPRFDCELTSCKGNRNVSEL